MLDSQAQLNESQSSDAKKAKVKKLRFALTNLFYNPIPCLIFVCAVLSVVFGVCGFCIKSISTSAEAAFGALFGLAVIVEAYLIFMMLYFKSRQKWANAKYRSEVAFIIIALVVSVAFKFVAIYTEVEVGVQNGCAKQQGVDFSRGFIAMLGSLYAGFGGLTFEGIGANLADHIACLCLYYGSSLFAASMVASIAVAKANYEMYSYILLRGSDLNKDIYVFTALTPDTICLAKDIMEQSIKSETSKSQKKGRINGRCVIVFAGNELDAFDRHDDLCRDVMANGFLYWSFSEKNANDDNRFKGEPLFKVLHLDNKNRIYTDRKFCVFAFASDQKGMPKEEENVNFIINDMLKRINNLSISYLPDGEVDTAKHNKRKNKNTIILNLSGAIKRNSTILHYLSEKIKDELKGESDDRLEKELDNRLKKFKQKIALCIHHKDYVNIDYYVLTKRAINYQAYQRESTKLAQILIDRDNSNSIEDFIEGLGVGEAADEKKKKLEKQYLRYIEILLKETFQFHVINEADLVSEEAIESLYKSEISNLDRKVKESDECNAVFDSSPNVVNAKPKTETTMFVLGFGETGQNLLQKFYVQTAEFNGTPQKCGEYSYYEERQFRAYVFDTMCIAGEFQGAHPLFLCDTIDNSEDMSGISNVNKRLKTKTNKKNTELAMFRIKTQQKEPWKKMKKIEDEIRTLTKEKENATEPKQTELEEKLKKQREQLKEPKEQWEALEEQWKKLKNKLGASVAVEANDELDEEKVIAAEIKFPQVVFCERSCLSIEFNELIDSLTGISENSVAIIGLSGERKPKKRIKRPNIIAIALGEDFDNIRLANIYIADIKDEIKNNPNKEIDKLTLIVCVRNSANNFLLNWTKEDEQVKVGDEIHNRISEKLKVRIVGNYEEIYSYDRIIDNKAAKEYAFGYSVMQPLIRKERYNEDEHEKYSNNYGAYCRDMRDNIENPPNDVNWSKLLDCFVKLIESNKTSEYDILIDILRQKKVDHLPKLDDYLDKYNKEYADKSEVIKSDIWVRMDIDNKPDNSNGTSEDNTLIDMLRQENVDNLLKLDDYLDKYNKDYADKSEVIKSDIWARTDIDKKQSNFMADLFKYRHCETLRQAKKDNKEPDYKRMSHLEHTRWVRFQISQGWRFGDRRDEDKYHDNIVPFAFLPHSKTFNDFMNVVQAKRYEQKLTDYELRNPKPKKEGDNPKSKKEDKKD